MVFGDVGICALDLYKAFGTDFLVATACSVEVWWVVEEAYRAFFRIAVQDRFDDAARNETGGNVDLRVCSGDRC